MREYYVRTGKGYEAGRHGGTQDAEDGKMIVLDIQKVARALQIRIHVPGLTAYPLVG